MEYKKEFDVKVPERGNRRSRNKEYLEVLDFIKSEHETMKFTYKTKEDAKGERSNLAAIVRKESIPVKLAVRGCEIYVIKKIVLLYATAGKKHLQNNSI